MAVRNAPAPVAGINFGSLDMYAAGGGLPDGDYILEDLTVQMYQAQTQGGISKGPQRLGVMITLRPLSEPTEENKRTQFYSMGGKADQSFAPNPETGKGLVAIPGAPATSLNNSTNWALFLKSMYDSGLPSGIFSNDLTVLDGVHVHMQNVPEPAERKGFASATSEATEERKAGTIAIVTEIKEDGKPWEGGGGLSEVKAPAAKTTAKAVAPKPAAAKVKPAPAPVPEQSGDEDVRSAAINGISTVLEKKPNGCPRLLLRTETFKIVKEAVSEDMAGAVISGFFEAGTEDALGGLLGELGYQLVSGQIKPA